jgi:hypothetical protein
MKGIGGLYSAFKESLRTNRTKLACLQVVSRLEEYLTKGFCSVIFLKSELAILPLTNPGQRSDRRKIDMALLEGDLSEALDKRTAKSQRGKLVIRAFVEVKYLRNRHRFGYSNAKDETDPILKNLSEQLGRFDLREYAGYRVNLRGHRKDIYGLVFVSHVRRRHEDDDREAFVQWVRQCGSKHGLRHWDLPKPQLDLVYANEPVSILRGEFNASLYAGLWRLAD